jgi:DNA polymerase III delta prime subunit
MVSHAYLFCGPRGTGKTTIAKIIARMVNCENLIDGKPCGKCYNCINFLNSNDIVEIDAASNNGVDEIRELRDKINLVPSNAKYKVYIIDEVHMLTTQAFNALLKTLEEPPAHVIFILATANKDSLRKIKEQWSLIDDYLYDDAYSVVAGLLKDSIPVVASEKYIIVSNSLESVANRINDNFSLIDEFLLKIFKNKIFIVGMSSDNWNVEKNKYISNIKNGVKYIEKDFINTDKIENKKSSVDELIDLMGENIIEYK